VCYRLDDLVQQCGGIAEWAEASFYTVPAAALSPGWHTLRVLTRTRSRLGMGLGLGRRPSGRVDDGWAGGPFAGGHVVRVFAAGRGAPASVAMDAAGAFAGEGSAAAREAHTPDAAEGGGGGFAGSGGSGFAGGGEGSGFFAGSGGARRVRAGAPDLSRLSTAFAVEMLSRRGCATHIRWRSL
jgi:hypothetical protein